MSHPLFSIGLYGDCQYTDADDAVDAVPGFTDLYYHCHYRQSEQKLQEAVSAFNQQKVDVVIDLGDFIDRGPADFLTVKPITDSLTMPLWHILGNHDYYAYKADTKAMVEAFDMPARYYSQQLHGFRFIMLDTNEISGVDKPLGSEAYKRAEQAIDLQRQAGLLQGYAWNGGLDEQQLTWLKNELSAASELDQKVIVCGHDPLYPASALNAINDQAIMAVLEGYPNVVAYFSGHFHMGAYGKRGGVHYVTVQGMLEGDQNSYGVAKVYSDHIDIQGFGRMSSYKLPIATS